MGSCGTYKRLTRVFLTATMLVLATVMVAGQGSGQVGTCAVSLTGCLKYINGTATPPPSCCTPLKDAVTNQKDCLCRLYADPAFLTAAGVNVTKAINLPTRCKISSDPDPANFCKGIAPSGSPSSSSNSPPSGGGNSGSGSGSKSNSGVTITRTRFVSSLIMFITYVIVNQ